MWKAFRAWLTKWVNDRPWLNKVSLVGLINFVGGVLLTLVLGLRAWAQTDLGRGYRLCAGALAIGIILGYVFYAVCPKVLSSLIDSSARPWIAFGVLPILLLAFTFYLESLRTKLG